MPGWLGSCAAQEAEQTGKAKESLCEARCRIRGERIAICTAKAWKNRAAGLHTS